LEILQTEGFDNIYEVDCFQNEFLGTVTEHPKTAQHIPRYQNWLLTKLAILDELGMYALSLPQFEALTNVDPKLYSIRYPKSPKNPRVLYVYVHGRKIILLAAFTEKNKSDYSNGIERALHRLRQLSKEEKL
jgi:phage-related protein